MLQARHALLAEGWRRDVRVHLAGGVIAAIECDVPPGRGDEVVEVLLPGMPNVHSHAFQRGMAGQTEVRGDTPDSFWTWREAMYRYALTMSPDDTQAIAAELYAEMLEAGFTRIGEFHYLHHDRDGRPYADVGEMAARICAAAAETGIGLTLLPAFYAHSNFGGAPPAAGQRRFINDLDTFAALVARCRYHAARIEGAVVGVAPHSLRAVTPDELSVLVTLEPRSPLHIHAAEQIKEVDDCLAWSSRRPVQWLLDNAPVDARWCLIHATHMTVAETEALARTGAVVGLCPVTEANLGDGIFNGAVFAAAGGRIGIGSDSNILIAIPDELRQLETTQRLRDHARNVLAIAGGSTGRALYERALAGGTQALGAPDPQLCVGAPADLVSLSLAAPQFAGRRAEEILDTWIFTGARAVDGVWVGGKRRVTGGRHHDRDAIERRFRTAMAKLAGA